MPKATRPCNYVEVTMAAVGPHDDGEQYLDFVSGECMGVADHQLVLSIQGTPDWHTDFLCCTHRSMVVEEIREGRSLGIEIVADCILSPVFDWKVQPCIEGGWECVIVVIAGATGARHTLPPARLNSTNRVAASIEAGAQVNRLRSIAAGNDNGEMPL